MATPNIAEYCGEFITTHREYAEINGYEYVCYSEKHPRFQNLHPVYSRLGFMQDAFQDGAERLIWADADVGFTNYSRDIGKLIDHGQVDIARGIGNWETAIEKSPGIWMAAYNQKNWPTTYLCFGLTVLRNNWLSRSFLDHVENLSRANPEIDNAREQAHVYDALAQISYAGVRACTALEIGCFARTPWNDGVIWQPSYPTVHLAAADWPQRQAIFHETYWPLIQRG